MARTPDRRGALRACLPSRPGGPALLALCDRCNRWHQLDAFTAAGLCRWPDTSNPRPDSPPDPLNATFAAVAGEE